MKLLGSWSAFDQYLSESHRIGDRWQRTHRFRAHRCLIGSLNSWHRGYVLSQKRHAGRLLSRMDCDCDEPKGEWRASFVNTYSYIEIFLSHGLQRWYTHSCIARFKKKALSETRCYSLVVTTVFRCRNNHVYALFMCFYVHTQRSRLDASPLLWRKRCKFIRVQP